MSEILRLKSTMWALSASRSNSAVSNSISPVENIIWASLRAIYCLGVGSNVSGLAPIGTKTSMLKSSPVICSTIYFNGAIVTYISHPDCEPFARLHPVDRFDMTSSEKSRVANDVKRIFIYTLYLFSYSFCRQRYKFLLLIGRVGVKSAKKEALHVIVKSLRIVIG